MEQESIKKDLKKIASIMNDLKKSESPKIHYDLMSDALWWSDERPKGLRAKETWCLRVIFRFRTTLIIDKQEEDYKDCWLEAKRLFPNWPGFEMFRCIPNEKLKSLYLEKHAKAFESID